jgi:hypothetical protein
MNAEQSGCVGAGFLARHHQVDDFSLLLFSQFRATPADTRVPPGRIASVFVRSHSMARSVREPTICILMRPAGRVVSMASVGRGKSAPASSYNDDLKGCRAGL